MHNLCMKVINNLALVTKTLNKEKSSISLEPVKICFERTAITYLESAITFLTILSLLCLPLFVPPQYEG